MEAKFEIDDSARSYRAHFLGYDHQNFTAVDEEFGPVVLSVKHYTDKEGEVKGNHVRVILRTTSGTIHRLLPYNGVKDTPSPIQLARYRSRKDNQLLINNLQVPMSRPDHGEVPGNLKSTCLRVDCVL